MNFFQLGGWGVVKKNLKPVESLFFFIGAIAGSQAGKKTEGTGKKTDRLRILNTTHTQSDESTVHDARVLHN